MIATTVYRLDLPFTRPPLTDNDRMHHMVKARKVAELREQVAWLAVAQRLPRGLEAVNVTFHWAPGSNRRRDVLSAAPTVKPLLDGLVDFGLVPDDDVKHVQLVTFCIHDWRRGVPAACWLTITPIEGDA